MDEGTATHPYEEMTETDSSVKVTPFPEARRRAVRTRCTTGSRELPGKVNHEGDSPVPATNHSIYLPSIVLKPCRGK